MKDYNRWTDKEHKYKGCVDCTYRNCQYCDDIVEYEKEAYNRLCDLEDKIENGTLIELPKKCYHIQWGLGLEINEYDIMEVQYDYYRGKITSVRAFRRNPTTHYIAGTRTFYFNELGETVFFTKSKAKAKLRELKGEQQ